MRLRGRDGSGHSVEGIMRRATSSDDEEVVAISGLHIEGALLAVIRIAISMIGKKTSEV